MTVTGNTDSFIITTSSSSVESYEGVAPAPFGLWTRIRGGCAPNGSFSGNIPYTPIDCSKEPTPDPLKVDLPFIDNDQPAKTPTVTQEQSAINLPVIDSSFEVNEPTITTAGCTELLVGQGQTFGTIQSAIDTIPVGVPLTQCYNIIIKDSATYTENVLMPELMTDSLAAITLKADSGQTPIIDGGGHDTCLQIGSSYVTVDGIKFVGWGERSGTGPIEPDDPAHRAAIYIGLWSGWGNPIGQGLHNIVINDCWTQGDVLWSAGQYYGVRVMPGAEYQAAHSITISNCNITTTSYGYWGLYFYIADQCEVVDCTIENYSDGIYFQGSEPPGLGTHHVHRNRLQHNSNRALFMTNQQNVRFANNLVWDCATTQGGHPFECTGNSDGLEVLYNTFVCTNIGGGSFGNGFVFPESWLDDGGTGATTWVNNIYRFTSPGDGLQLYNFPENDQLGIRTNTLSDNNVFSLVKVCGAPGSPPSPLCDYISRDFAPSYTQLNYLAEWQATAGKDLFSVEEYGSVVTIFTDEAGDDFTLIQGSVAANAAQPVGTITHDILGNLRDLTSPSIGCYESLFAPTIPPITLPKIDPMELAHPPSITGGETPPLVIALPKIDPMELAHTPSITGGATSGVNISVHCFGDQYCNDDNMVWQLINDLDEIQTGVLSGGNQNKEPVALANNESWRWQSNGAIPNDWAEMVVTFNNLPVGEYRILVADGYYQSVNDWNMMVQVSVGTTIEYPLDGPCETGDNPNPPRPSFPEYASTMPFDVPVTPCLSDNGGGGSPSILTHTFTLFVPD